MTGSQAGMTPSGGDHRHPPRPGADRREEAPHIPGESKKIIQLFLQKPEENEEADTEDDPASTGLSLQRFGSDSED